MLWTWDHILRTDLPYPSLLACQTKDWSLLPRMPFSNHSELCLVWANWIYDRAVAVWSTRLLLLRFRHLSPFIFGNLLLYVLMLSYLVDQVPDSWMVTLAYTLSQYKPLALSNLSLSLFFFFFLKIPLFGYWHLQYGIIFFYLIFANIFLALLLIWTLSICLGYISYKKYRCSVAKSCLALWPHGLQHARLPCPSLLAGVCSNSCPLSQWCHPTISSSVALFSSCPQSFPTFGSFPVSQLFTSGGQSIGASASASVLSMI